jgi:predicted PurR-regulated permease PerM
MSFDPATCGGRGVGNWCATQAGSACRRVDNGYALGPWPALPTPSGPWSPSSGALVLIAAALWIVRPFLVALVWATAIVVVTWPAMLGLQARLRGSRAAAVTVVVVLLLLLVVVPLTLAVVAIVLPRRRARGRARTLATFRTGPAPAWLTDLPLVGDRLRVVWQDVAGAGADGLWSRIAPYAGTLAAWLVGKIGNFGYQGIQFLLTLVLATFMYLHGRGTGQRGRAPDTAALGDIRRRARPPHEALDPWRRPRGRPGRRRPVAARRHWPRRCRRALRRVLTALLFLLCLAQVGMLVLLIPIVVWVFWSGDTSTGILLLLWSVAVSVLDQSSGRCSSAAMRTCPPC